MCFVPVVHSFYVETARLSLEKLDRVFEIKYDGGSSMTYKEAAKLARVCRPSDDGKSDIAIKVDDVKIAGFEKKPGAHSYPGSRSRYTFTKVQCLPSDLQSI